MNCSYEELWNIVSAYGESLEKQPRLVTILGLILSQESMLPYPKKTIKHALATLLLIEEDSDAISLLAGAYTDLNSFVSDEVYEICQ